MTSKTTLLAAGLALGLASQASAGDVTAASYTFDQPTDIGSYDYQDNTGRQLIDGHYGVAPWFADLGNGPAYEWVGWYGKPLINIDFDMGGTKAVGSILVGSVQDNLGDVVVPDILVYSSLDGIIWTLAGQRITPRSSANDNQHFELALDNLGINAPFIRVSVVEDAGIGPWSFVDEVDFNRASLSSVPDGGATAGLLAGTAFLLAGLRKRFGVAK